MMENFDSKYKMKNPFSVPENYFDELTGRIEKRVIVSKQRAKVSVVNLVKPYIGLVAIFLLALLVVQGILPHVIDSSKMLVKEGEQTMATTMEYDEERLEFNVGFNPTGEEIWEYLSTEVDDYELLYADLF